MSIESNLLTTVQEIYFDLVDLESQLYLKGIELKGFEEFSNLLEFVDEQRGKLLYLENHMKILFKLTENDDE
jgi:hypothetical protein